MTDEQELSPEELKEKRKREAEELKEKEMGMLEKWGIEYNFPDPFLQRDLQKYQTRLTKLGSTNETAVSVYKGLLLKVAVELGWMKGKVLNDIGALTPGQVTLISNLVFEDVVEASQIPNE